jgi:MFS family permease
VHRLGLGPMHRNDIVRRGLRAIPRSIWALGFVSLLMDTSSELIQSLLPVFLVSTLGASMVSVGVIEGVAEATALITKIFSGTLSDYLGKRKLLTVIGYGLAALTKPLFPLAASVEWVVTARVLDRLGKGIRGAPRDALVGDLAPPHLRGACYGLRQSLDTVGAFTGPLLAMGLMVLLAQQLRSAFWFAVVPACLAVLLLVVGVREPPTEQSAAGNRTPLRAANFRQLGAAYWHVVLLASLLGMARFSEAFLILRAHTVGVSLVLVPLVLVVMNVAYAASAYPAGYLSDRLDRRYILAVGCAVLLGSEIVLGVATMPMHVMVGVGFWGLHMGFTHGLLAALVTDTAPASLRGTAFGIFNLVGGIAALAASVLAGWLWDHYGPPATFAVGAVFSAVALGRLLLTHQRGPAA